MLGSGCCHRDKDWTTLPLLSHGSVGALGKGETQTCYSSLAPGMNHHGQVASPSKGKKNMLLILLIFFWQCGLNVS